MLRVRLVSGEGARMTAWQRGRITTTHVCFLERCSTCGDVLRECRRCASPDKPVTFLTCENCQPVLAKTGARA